MIDQIEINHHIQKHILGVLLRQKVARFRDMRAPKTDSNLYSYHLTQLLKDNLVKKVDSGYTLDTKGLIYVDRLNAEKLFIRQQPKIITMFVIQNSDGDVLLQCRTKQPYIDMWTLPNGKLHNDDSSIHMAAQREAYEKLNIHSQEMTHAGDCYMRVHYGDTAVTITLAHIFTFNRDDIEMTDQLQWVQPHKLQSVDLAPSIEQIIARTFFRDTFFFEEYSFEW
jgi:8-oxo-dGTP pyrophosphatase MutT (NUDIX family)